MCRVSSGFFEEASQGGGWPGRVGAVPVEAGEPSSRFPCVHLKRCQEKRPLDTYIFVLLSFISLMLQIRIPWSKGLYAGEKLGIMSSVKNMSSMVKGLSRSISW